MPLTQSCKVNVKGQIIYLAVNASSPKPLDIATQTLQVHRSHDVEDTALTLIFHITHKESGE